MIFDQGIPGQKPHRPPTKQETKALDHAENTTQHCVGGGVVHPWHIDQFGHMNVRWYAHFFDDASFQFMMTLGLDQSGAANTSGAHCVTAQSTVQYKAELVAGNCVQIFATLARIGRKSVTIRFRMTDRASGKLYATCETVEVFVNPATHASMVIPDDLRTTLAKFTTPPQ